MAAGRSSRPLRISDDTGDARDGDGTLEGAVPAVGPKGEVYVAWAGPKGLSFDRSDDGGWTFGADKLISPLTGGWDIPVPGVERHNGMPVTAVDLSSGPNKGTLYVNFIDERNGDTDVFLLASKDGGTHVGTAGARERRSEGRGADVHVDGRGPRRRLRQRRLPRSARADGHDDRADAGAQRGWRQDVRQSPHPDRPLRLLRGLSVLSATTTAWTPTTAALVAVFPVITGGQQRIMAATMRFRPGTQS